VTRKPFTICSLGFLGCSFRVTHLTVSCGAVPVSFSWSWLSSQLELLFDNFGWQYVCVLSHHTAESLDLVCDVERLFCSRLIALVLILLSFAPAQRKDMRCVLNADLLNSKFLMV